MNLSNNVKSFGPTVFHCIRLHRGDDLLLSIKELAERENIKAAAVISSKFWFDHPKLEAVYW